nr:bifunctional nicotinamidase/pyrazinamidase [uncultured Rhodopila sp.]
MQIYPDTDIIGVVDVQPTFMPGGELPVPGGHEVVPIINDLLTRFAHAFVTQDWHPPGHASFASAHSGKQPYDTHALPYGEQVLWPDHGIAGTPSAAIHPELDQSRVQVVIRKGFHPGIDSYSAFFENDHRTPTGLEGWLRQRGFTRLFLCGLATDFCVAWSAEDAARLGFEVVVIEDACRGIGLPAGDGRTTIDEARDRLAARGVQFIASSGLRIG